jgi:hypothetical protein
VDGEHPAEDASELHREQRERTEREERLADEAEQPAEARQHARRRDKADYLAEKLAERERADEDG